MFTYLERLVVIFNRRTTATLFESQFDSSDVLSSQTIAMERDRPIYPGEFIISVYMKPFDISPTQLAESLDVDQTKVSQLLVGDASVFPEMAVRLAAVLGGSSYFWLNMQSQYSLWQAEQQVNLSRLKQIVFK